MLEEEGNPKSVQELIDEYDLDKDGKINYEVSTHFTMLARIFIMVFPF